MYINECIIFFFYFHYSQHSISNIIDFFLSNKNILSTINLFVVIVKVIVMHKLVDDKLNDDSANISIHYSRSLVPEVKLRPI